MYGVKRICGCHPREVTEKWQLADTLLGTSQMVIALFWERSTGSESYLLFFCFVLHSFFLKQNILMFERQQV